MLFELTGCGTKTIIKENAELNTIDVVEYCKDKVLDKNWYCEVDNVRITINYHSYTIITAHILK